MTVGLIREQMGKILIIGDDLRSFLAIVRSLGRAGYEVHAAPFDFSSPALASRYIRMTHRVPRYAVAPEKWLKQLQSLIAEHNFSLIIPCGDNHLLPLAHHQAVLAAPIALPGSAALEQFFDKVKTRALATQQGVPVATGGPVSDELIANIGLPFALKPRASVNISDVAQRGAVRIVRTPDEVASALGRAVPADDYFLEAYFAGEGVGLSVLARHGEIVQAFQHRRLAETSESGGSSSRVSEAVTPALMDVVRAMCAAISYQGVAMFEFRRNAATGAFVLLEVNARFWGSLPLAVACGVDFPADLVALMLRDEVVPRRQYPEGVIRRHLTAEYYRVLHDSEQASGAFRRNRQRLVQLVALATRVMLMPAQFDSFAKDDLAPFRAERRRMTNSFLNSLTHKIPVNSSALSAQSQAKLRRLLMPKPHTPSLVFICLGNICRSPFAAGLAAVRIAGATIASAGTLMRAGRSSPEDAISCATRFGVSLDGHRSHMIDMDELERADVIFIFDDRNAEDLAQLGVDSKKVIMLGHLTGSRTVEDPYSRGPAAFMHCYTQIAAAMDVIAAAVDAR